MPKSYYPWNDNPLGKCQIKIRREMLTERGFFHRPSNSRNRGDLNLNFAIHYDKEYVYQFVIEKLIKNLLIDSKDELLQLSSEVWEYYHKKN